MNIVLIGSGNVATVLGRLIKAKGHKILQVISRNIDHAKILADELECDFSNYEGVTNPAADMYIVSINDSTLYDLSKTFSLENKLIVHTAGSVPIDVLQNISTNYGVMYPLQTLRKEIECINPIPFLVNANNPSSKKIIIDFVATFSSHVKMVEDDEKLKLHLAAVLVNNFTNHLYAMAADFCEKEKVDFDLLKPLIKETTERMLTHSPKEMQTGPALRNDVYTLDKHLKLLATHPKLKYVYLKMSEAIMNP
jgi:predicted short-subunit dehydrogenase-like oxidoreductase (DUF2520 family)